jgi:hypothetical protein
MLLQQEKAPAELPRLPIEGAAQLLLVHKRQQALQTYARVANPRLSSTAGVSACPPGGSSACAHCKSRLTPTETFGLGLATAGSGVWLRGSACP